VNLTYENGLLSCGSTRGKGDVGEEILSQIRTIRSIPLSIPFKGRMEVQGECYMRLSVLEELNKSADEPLKNARNAAAGALRNLDPKVTASRKLDCVCYNIGYIEEKSFENHREMLDFLRENGFPVSNYVHYHTDMDRLFADIEEVNKHRGELDFLIDGMVIKILDFETRKSLGATERFPRWAIAYKFPAEEVTTTVEEVSWEVGRTGKLTPRATLSPVELSGATIRHATLNNYDDILRKRVGIGSRVFLRRSNEVIPEILGAVEGDRNGIPIEKPVRCPACGAHVEHRGVHLYCTNSMSCKPQIVARLSHFASKNAMDIEGFSEKTAELLVEALGFSSIPDLYRLDAPALSVLPGFGDKKIKNLLEAIEKSKDCSLGAFLFAIGIPNVGAKTARDLAESFGSLRAVMEAEMEALLLIPDIGEIVAESIVDFFRDPSIEIQIERLLEAGVKPREEVQNAVTEGPIAGKTLVVTGSMEKRSRLEMEALIMAHGGKASSSVSKKTDYLIAGEKAGSKLDKALKLGVSVLNETEFLKMIGEEDA